MKTFAAMIDALTTEDSAKIFSVYVVDENEEITLDIEVMLRNSVYTFEIESDGKCIVFDEHDTEEDKEKRREKHFADFKVKLEENKELYEKIANKLIEEFKADDELDEFDSFDFEVDI